jgi:hypothetical protein
MNPYVIFRNPIIKLICIGLVLYFALFKNKDNPNSLGNRLSVDKIKQGVSQANQKSFSIVSGIALAKQQEVVLKHSDTNNKEIGNADNLVSHDQNGNNGLAPVEIKPPIDDKIKPLVGDHIIVQDLEMGSGNDILSCGRQADISYKIIAKNNNKELRSISNARILIGGGTDLLLENKIIGMKKNGLRVINVFKSFKTEDKKLAILLRGGSDLIFQVRLINILPPNKIDNSNVRCD